MGESSQSSKSNNSDNRLWRQQQPPAPIEYLPGHQIQLILGEFGSDYACVRNTCRDDGVVVEQSRDTTSCVTGPPSALRQRMKQCRGEFCIRSVSYGPGGEWFLHGRRWDGEGESAWWDVATTECSDFLSQNFQTTRNDAFCVAFGPHSSYVVVNGHHNCLVSKGVPRELRARILNVQRLGGHVQHVSLFRRGGYFVADTEGCPDLVGAPPGLAQDLKQRGIHDLVTVTVAGDENWVVVRKEEYQASPGVCRNLEAKLSKFYQQHRTYRLERENQIRAHQEWIRQEQHEEEAERLRAQIAKKAAQDKQRHKEREEQEQRELELVEKQRVRQLLNETRRQRQAGQAQQQQQQQQQQVEVQEGADQQQQQQQEDDVNRLERQKQQRRERDVLARRKRQRASRLAVMRAKGLLHDSHHYKKKSHQKTRVTVAGFSNQPGDAVIQSIHLEDGTMVVARIDNPTDTIRIEEPRRVCAHQVIESPMAEVIKLMKATDKFEAAVAEFECQLLQDNHDNNNNNNNNSEKKGTSTSRNCSPLPDSLEKSDSENTIETATSSMDSPTHSPTRPEGRSSGSLSKVASTSTTNSQVVVEGEEVVEEVVEQEEEQEEEEEQLFLPVFEERGEFLPLDEFRCAEKIDFGRLEALREDLKTDTIARKEFMDNMTRRRKLHPDRETRVEAALFKKLQRCHELEKVVDALHTTLLEYPTTTQQCVIREVAYTHKDVSHRGRLFAQGKSVPAIEGRYPRNTTLQTMCDDWRAPLVGAFAHEIECDLSDIHIICSLAAQLNLSELIPTIMAYKTSPQEWIDKISRIHNVPAKVAKKWPDIIVAGGLYIYKSWLRTMDLDSPEAHTVKKFTCGIAAEIAVFSAELLRHPKFKWTVLESRHLREEGKRGAALTTTLVNRILRSCETEIIGIVHRCLENVGWQVRSKIFDGLLVEQREGSERTLEEALKLAETACKLQGWQVKLVEKPLRGLQDEPIKTVVEGRQALFEISRSVLARRRRSSQEVLEMARKQESPTTQQR